MCHWLCQCVIKFTGKASGTPTGETDRKVPCRPDGTIIGRLNNKATQWWTLTFNQLGTALRSSFKLPHNPLQNPHLADEWESYLAERKTKIQTLTRELADAQAELNDRVYRLFQLTEEEIKLLQREVEH